MKALLSLVSVLGLALAGLSAQEWLEIGPPHPPPYPRLPGGWTQGPPHQQTPLPPLQTVLLSMTAVASLEPLEPLIPASPVPPL